MILETRRLILRPWSVEDAADLYEYASDPRVGPPAGWPVHTSVDNSRETIIRFLSFPETYAVMCKDTGKVVGSVGLKLGDHTDLTHRDDEAEVGYWIGVPYWGQGLIPEAVERLMEHAFLELGLRALWCGYYDGNVKSRRVQEKCGFVHHHSTPDIYVELLDEYRLGHVTCLSRERWEARGAQL